jgi:hypothetical protein
MYRSYLEIEYSGELRNDFYVELKQTLVDLGYNIQNTRDAALLVRLVFGKDVSNSKIWTSSSVEPPPIEKTLLPTQSNLWDDYRWALVRQ